MLSSGLSRMRCLSPSSFSVLSSAFPSQSSSSFLLFRSCTTETKEKKKVLVLFGPTGIGKTTVAIELAKLLNGELVSCDSVQLYKGVSIGANIATDEELGGIKQHAVSFVPLGKRYSAAEYIETSYEIIDDIIKRGKVPVVVGGSFFYLSWFLKNRSPSAPADLEHRKAIMKEIEEDDDWEVSFSKLKALDPTYATKLETNDYKRLIRALEVNRSKGKTMAEVENESIGEPNPYNLCCISLHPPSRIDLWRSLDVRCEKMVERGFLKEVKELLDNDREGTITSLGTAIGYRETIDFLDWIEEELKQNGGSLKEKAVKDRFVEYLKRFQCTTRRLVRKQTCWIRQTEHPFTIIEKKGVFESVSKILRAYVGTTPPESIHHQIENEDEQVTRRYTSNITVFNNSYKIFEALTSQIGLCSTQQQQQSQQQHQEGQYDTDNYKRRKERSQRQPNEPQQQKIQQKQKPQQPQQPQPQQPQETQQPQRQEEAEQRRQRNKQKRRQYSKMAQESRGKKKKRGGRRGWGNEREAMGENIDGYYSS